MLPDLPLQARLYGGTREPVGLRHRPGGAAKSPGVVLHHVLVGGDRPPTVLRRQPARGALLKPVAWAVYSITITRNIS